MSANVIGKTTITTSDFLDFIRLVVRGDISAVRGRLADRPDLATALATMSATREESSAFFLAEIAPYVYAGDTALHMAATAFRRDVAARLVAHGADCWAKNRRGAGPLGDTAAHDRTYVLPQVDIADLNRRYRQMIVALRRLAGGRR